jgi:spore germination protein GerM
VTARLANFLTVLGLLLFLALVSITAPKWSSLLRGTGPRSDETPAGDPKAKDAAAGHRVEKTINVKLFFQAADRTGLAIEERAVSFSPDLSQQIKSVVEELVQGPKMTAGLLPTLPPATKVLEVFVTKRGIAYVDLSKEVREGQPGGSEAELITVYSVVDSLTASFPAVKKVQILVDDHPAPTLAGHVDLTRPLGPDMTFLASTAVSPASQADQP